MSQNLVFDKKILKTTRVSLNFERVNPYSAEIILFNPFKPEFTIVIFIRYKPRNAVAIHDL